MNTQKKSQLKSKAIIYVPLCQGNHIAAALFDWLLTYTEIEVRLRYHEPFYIDVESAGGPLANPSLFLDCLGYHVDVDANLEVKLTDLRAIVTPQLLPPATVTDQELFDALDLLQHAHLASVFLAWEPEENEDPRSPDVLLGLRSLYLPHVDEVLTVLHYGHRVTESKSMYDATRERRVVREQRSRAGRIGQAATLTFEEWIETLAYFGGRCTFSAEHPYEVLEHFIPVSYGGGTTSFNCVPACRACNAIKNDRLPIDLRETRLGEALSRIQAYLDQRREQWLSKYA